MMELTVIVESKIYEIRGQKVMIDKDLAGLYQIEVKRLNESVKRNIKRFPSDFMFQLTTEEWLNLKSQFATSSWGGSRKLPYVFTEQGVAMLSSVLNSDTAIEVNIAIMRAFVTVRRLTSSLSPIDRLGNLEQEVIPACNWSSSIKPLPKCRRKESWLKSPETLSASKRDNNHQQLCQLS